jgi:hypothetical protein
MIRLYSLLLWIASVLPGAISAQINGGRNTFAFLSLSPSARATALGGTQISVRDDETAFAALNPAALNPSMSGRLTFNHNFFLSDIQHGYAAYAHHLKKTGFTLHGGIQYVNYGEIKQADEWGNVTGSVRARETAFIAGVARPLSERWSLGLNVRFAQANLDMYSANALAADAGILRIDTTRRTAFAFVIRNAGAQMATFNGTREALPFDVQAAFSKRLAHLPFRFTVIAHHLHQWDIRYDDPALQQSDFIFLGEEQDDNQGSPVIDNFFRHLIFNGEFLFGPTEGFRLRFGYNHLRKRELSVNDYRSLAGFSAGMGVKIKRFRIDVGYAAYHLAGGVMHLGIGTNLRDYFK